MEKNKTQDQSEWVDYTPPNVDERLTLVKGFTRLKLTEKTGRYLDVTEQ